MNKPKPIIKYGVQVTVADPNDNAYCVYQLVQYAGQTEYTRLGPIIWIDKAKPNPGKRLMDAIRIGLSGDITESKSM